jgi:hypothetical protein
MKKIKWLLLISLIISFSRMSGQDVSASWDQFKWLLGDWSGEGSGRPGQGTGRFTFTLDLDCNVMIRKAFSEYPATDNKPAIIHEDIMIIYRDMSGKPDKAIYFDNENHVINYSVTSSDNSVVFLSDKKGTQPYFRLSYTKLGEDQVDTKFEVSQDGVNFMVYIEGNSTKNE